MKIRFLFGTLLFVASAVSAHDFTTVVDGQTLYFDIVSKTARTAKVTYRGSIADNTPVEVRGVVTIPSKVRNGNVTYTVSAIGPKAFCNAKELTGIVMPQGIGSIGDFAFEGCVKLEKVVLPGNSTKIGQGVFFRCTNIKDVSIGSDWTAIDLAMFRWSDSLDAISIPAKMEKIHNMKKLKGLKEVTVDPNNTRFASHGGSLYNKDGSVLYGVPRAMAGKLKVADGTKSITAGAIADCTMLSSIDLPATVTDLPMRELSELGGLDTLVLRSAMPMTTGYLNGKGMLVLQVANPKIHIAVPHGSKKAYLSALAVEQGEYTKDTKAGSIAYTIMTAQLPTAKSIEGVKSFTNYE